jgi:murein DD-endopeptidase MepM/ murein hydrolase activator NlpD
MRLLAPICRVFIGTDEFLVGDRHLRSVEVTLSEDARASKCSFEIYDPGLVFADKYFAMSFRDGGIQVPKDLLEDPNKGELGRTYELAGGGSGTGSTANYTALPGVASAFEGGNQSLIARAVGHSEGNRSVSGGFTGSYNGHTDPGNGASNIGSFSYQTQQGGASTPEEADQLWLNRLQSQMPAYEAAAKAGGYDPADPRLLTNFTDLYTQSPLAATGSGGFLEQIAKGGGNNSYDSILQARLQSYRNPTTGSLDAPGFGNSLSALTADQNRRMQALESVLQQSGQGGGTQPEIKKVPTQYPDGAGSSGVAQAGVESRANSNAAKILNDTIDSSAKQPSIEDKAASKPVEVAAKGTEIIIEFGYSLDAMTAYHFIHIGTEVNGRSLDTTRFEGQTIRWLMTRRTKNTTYGNITLREFAQKVATAYGFELEMEGDGPKYQHLDQTGLTDYELLLRECRAIGYSIQDDKNKLIIKPWRPRFQGFVITQDMLISIRFSDRADKDRQGKAGTATNTQSQPETPAADSKTKIDKLEGSVIQTKTEDSTGTGKATGASTSANQVLKSAQGFLSSAFGGDLDTSTEIETATTASSVEGLLQSGFSGATSKAKDLVASVTGSPSAAVTGSPAPESSATTSSTEDATTGLPRQEIGAIDLADGKAEAVAIKDESRRVKGYESSAVIITTPEALTIAPGSIIGISRNIVPETFAREWRVGQVRHALQPGSFRTTLEFYTPQAAKSGEQSRDFSLANPEKQTAATAPPGKLQNPLPGTARGTPFDPGGAIRGRPHTGIDMSSGGNAPVIAAESGTVSRAGVYGGYGNGVQIDHDGQWQGWNTFYAHLDSISVSLGQKVSKGQTIGVEGNTGGSYGAHLHFELQNSAGAYEDPEVYFCPAPTGVYGEGAGYPIRSKC